MKRDWAGTLSRIADTGYLGVETAGFEAATPVALKQRCGDLGLTIVAAHSPLPLGRDQEKVLDNVAVLECSRLVLGGTGHDKFNTVDDIRRQAALFNQAYEAAANSGLELGLHNHWWEFGQVDGRLAFDRLDEDLDASIFFEIDTYWASAAGVDPVALLERLGERAPLLHLKDGPLNLEAPHVALGLGAMDLRAVVAAGHLADWLIVELDHCATNMFDAVADSYRFLTESGLGRGSV